MRNILKAAVVVGLATYCVVVSVLLSRFEARLGKLEQNLVAATSSTAAVVQSINQKVESVDQQFASIRSEMTAKKMFNPSIRDLPPQENAMPPPRR